MSDAGYIGVAALMLLENVFPPIPSELVMPLAGFLSAQGSLWLPLAILVGTFGSVLGTLLWYAPERHFGRPGLRRLADSTRGVRIDLDVGETGDQIRKKAAMAGERGSRPSPPVTPEGAGMMR